MFRGRVLRRMSQSPQAPTAIDNKNSKTIWARDGGAPNGSLSFDACAPAGSANAKSCMKEKRR